MSWNRNINKNIEFIPGSDDNKYQIFIYAKLLFGLESALLPGQHEQNMKSQFS